MNRIKANIEAEINQPLKALILSTLKDEGMKDYIEDVKTKLPYQWNDELKREAMRIILCHNRGFFGMYDGKTFSAFEPLTNIGETK